MTSILGNVTRYPVVFDHGRGCELFDEDGRRYLDFLSGIAVCCLGHAHPDLTRAVAEQAAKLLHVSNLFSTRPMLDAADDIVARIAPGKVYFANSGAEANEAALKLVRKRAFRAGEPDRNEVVALEGSFHGRTYGALSLTIQRGKWEGFAPMPGGVVAVEPNDVAALDAAITERTAAVLVEPIQGEIGIRPLTASFLGAARKLTRERGALLVVDEIQTGMGRTGTWWGYQHYPVDPDVVTLAKGLGGGVPVGAMWVAAAHADALRPSDHGTTQGGNPLSCAAVSTTFRVIERDGLLANAKAMGGRLREALLPLGTEVRGLGLLLALDLGRPVSAQVVQDALDRGLIVNNVNETSVRLAPPLVVTADECDEAVSILADAVRHA